MTIDTEWAAGAPVQKQCDASRDNLEYGKVSTGRNPALE